MNLGIFFVCVQGQRKGMKQGKRNKKNFNECPKNINLKSIFINFYEKKN